MTDFAFCPKNAVLVLYGFQRLY